MILNHPCIRYAHITPIEKKSNSQRTLVIGTTLSLPNPGQPCMDDRLLDLLEYLELIKREYKGEFDSVEIRGISKEEKDLDLPHFIPRGERCMNGVCV